MFSTNRLFLFYFNQIHCEQAAFWDFSEGQVGMSVQFSSSMLQILCSLLNLFQNPHDLIQVCETIKKKKKHLKVKPRSSWMRSLKSDKTLKYERILTSWWSGISCSCTHHYRWVSKFALLSSPDRMTVCPHPDFHFESQKKVQLCVQSKWLIQERVPLDRPRARGTFLSVKTSKTERAFPHPLIYKNKPTLPLHRPPPAFSDQSYNLTHTHTHPLTNPTQSLM